MKSGKRDPRRLTFETLENRELLSGTPLGPAPQDDYGNTFADAALVSVPKSKTLKRVAVIEAAGDVDMFRVVASKSGIMTVSQKAAGSAVDARLEIYGKARQLLAADNDGIQARLPIRVTAGSTYYVAASAAEGTTGQYSLEFRISAFGDDYGSTRARAAPFGLGTHGNGKRSGTIESVGDRDFLLIAAPRSGQMTVTVTAGANASLSPSVTVYGAAGNLLQHVEQSGSQRRASAQFIAIAGRKYYIRVSGNGSTTGAYTLQVKTAEMLIAVGRGPVVTPLFYRTDLAFQSGRLHEPSADAEGNVWFSPLDGRLMKYVPSTGAMQVFDLEQLTGRSWAGLHLWPVAAGREIYLCSPSLPEVWVYDDATQEVQHYALPYGNPQLFGGFAVGPNTIYFYDTGVPGIVKWDTTLHEATLIPCPYPLSGTLYMTFADPARGEIWGSVYAAGGDLVRFDMTTDQWTGHWNVPGAATTPGNAVVDGTLYLSDHLNGKLIPFDIDRGTFGTPIAIPGYRKTFGYVGGGVYYRGLFYLCHSTWSGGTSSIDGKRHHFTGFYSVFDPRTGKFSRLDVPTKSGESFVSSYALVAGDRLFMSAVNLNGPHNAVMLHT